MGFTVFFIMKTIWYIEQDVYDDNPEIMMEIVKELGMEGIWFRYTGDIENKHTEDSCVIVYGSINSSIYVQRKKPWIPGVWCDFKELKCSTYLSHWGKYSVHKNYLFLPLSEVYRKKDWIFKTFGKTVFIRPDDNSKSFHGELVADEKFEDWYDTANSYNPGKKCMTLVSEPSKIEAEYRFVISEKKVLTGSQYDEEGIGVFTFPEDASKLAEEIANSCEFNPHSMYIMDICKLENKEYRLMEIGSVNCAGLYACDLRKFVEKMSELGLEEWKDLQ